MFGATPFLIVPLAERYGVSEGLTGSISVAQVGAFALANFLLPRLLRPNGRILRAAATALVALNLLSILPSQFFVLVPLRLFAGFAAGTMTWLTWSNAMTRKDSMSSIAMTGPLTALVLAPVIATISGHGDRAVFLFLAVMAVPAALFWGPVAGRKQGRGVLSASRSNRLLLLALFGMTFFGSSLYINLGLVARDIHELSPLMASIGFSLNAAGGFAGARLSERHRIPGWFAMTIAPAVLLTVYAPTPFFFAGMFWWGFGFWMAIPGILQMLVDRSLEPAERAGDGQGVLALGRSLGPALGGFLVDNGTLQGLAATAAIGVAISGLGVVGVKEGRDRLPPTDPRTIDQVDGI